MKLPIEPPYLPMEAESVARIPEGDDWQYEPKWDGFRCLVFRDGDEVQLQSKSAQPLARYFPELVAACRQLKPARFVLDGEIVIPFEDGFSFDSLLRRIHPAASRIAKLATETPARLILFDFLVDARGQLLADAPLLQRRAALEHFAHGFLKGHASFELSPATCDAGLARQWLATLNGTLDGVIAKRTDLAYQSGERSGMVKVKNLRTADCVVGGFRYAEKKTVVGSLLLGLFDADGLLHHVGFTSGLASAEKPALTKKLEALIGPPGFTGKAPGGPSRWSSARSAEWQPLKTKLVVEVRYDHFTGGRFRHGTRLERWRPDKAPRQCLLRQVQR